MPLGLFLFPGSTNASRISGGYSRFSLCCSFSLVFPFLPYCCVCSSVSEGVSAAGDDVEADGVAEVPGLSAGEAAGAAEDLAEAEEAGALVGLEAGDSAEAAPAEAGSSRGVACTFFRNSAV